MFLVFIGSSTESRAYAEIVEDVVREHPLFDAQPWWTAFRAGGLVYDQILKQLPVTDFAIFLTTPDDTLESRNKTFPVSRANVLLEYGLFSGHLGSENALRLHIGKSSAPSDLYGVVDVFAQVEYKPNISPSADDEAEVRRATADALSQFLKPSDQCATLDIRFIRGRNFNDHPSGPDHVRRVLEDQQLVHLNSLKSLVRNYDHISDIISKHTKHTPQTVGLDDHPSKTKYFVDFDAIRQNPDDERLLSAAFSHFVATYLLKHYGDAPPSRFAVHDRLDQLSFLSRTLTSLNAKPAIVSVTSRTGTGEVKGRFLKSENSVLLQAVTSTGNIPCHCYVELAEKKIQNRALLSFIAKSEHATNTAKICESHHMAFEAMFLQGDDGTLTLNAK